MLTDVSPLVSWTPHRCLWMASRTRASPLLQYWSRAEAVCRALWDALLWRAVAANQGHVMSVTQGSCDHACGRVRAGCHNNSLTDLEELTL